MKRGRIWLILGVLLTATIAVVISLSAASAAESAFLPGITVNDDFPNGCVSCHKVDGDNDYRLTAELAKVKGHPNIAKLVTKVPSDCAKCHKEKGAAPALNTVVHKAHFKDPENNPFILNYKGACLNCHTLDLKSGVVSVKSGTKNW